MDWLEKVKEKKEKKRVILSSVRHIENKGCERGTEYEVGLPLTKKPEDCGLKIETDVDKTFLQRCIRRKYRL